MPEYYLPYLFYAYDTEKKTVVEAEGIRGLNNIKIPRSIYENGIIEIYYRTVRSINYRFHQLQKNCGALELIGEYTEIYYNESIDNDEPAYYKGIEYSGEKITEEEYQDAITYYKSIPQIEIEWHELDDFWEEYSHSEKEGEAEKNNEPITVMTKETWFYLDDGSLACWYKYEYDSAGNLTKDTMYGAYGSIWFIVEYEYYNRGNKTRRTTYRYDEYYERGEVYELRKYEYITIIPSSEVTGSN